MNKELLFCKDCTDYVVKDSSNFAIEYVIFNNEISIKYLFDRFFLDSLIKNELIHFKIINKTRGSYALELYKKVKSIFENLEQMFNDYILSQTYVNS